MKLDDDTTTVTAMTGGYTASARTTMKQINTAQLDITACQAQAAEHHAQGFNCAQAGSPARSHLPSDSTPRSPLPSPRASVGMGGMTENLRRHLGRCGHHGLCDERRHETPRPRARTLQAVARNRQAFWREEHDDRLRHRPRASDRIRVRSAAWTCCIDDAIEIAQTC